jgi:hypothetical protein
MGPRARLRNQTTGSRQTCLKTPFSKPLVTGGLGLARTRETRLIEREAVSWNRWEEEEFVYSMFFNTQTLNCVYSIFFIHKLLMEYIKMF